MKRFAIKVFDFFSSVKLAVILLLSLSAILAVGTFYEADYGSAAAQRVIYHSWYVSVLMFLLIANLACAAIDRLPWRKYHIGFVTTHAGIIILILGSFITQQRGVDGTLAVGINEAADAFTVEDTVLRVYQNLDGKPFSLLFDKDVDFDRRPPEKKQYTFPLIDDDVLKVTRYYPKAVRKVDVTESHSSDGSPALQFKLFNDRVDVTEWLGLDNQIPPFYDLGPALITFVKSDLLIPPQPRNQILIYQNPKTGILNYAIFSVRQAQPLSKGRIKLHEDIPTGWMNLTFRVDQYFPHARAEAHYESVSQDSANAVPVIEAGIGGRRGWFEVDSPHEIRGDKSTYFVSFVHKRYSLGFRLTLKKFKMGTYGGSLLPKSYESTVSVSHDGGKKDAVISMNEPLHENGFTLYQSSFEQNDRGEPILSVFAVNHDPGRRMKYFGAICIVAGIGIMFYIKPRWTRKKKV